MTTTRWLRWRTAGLIAFGLTASAALGGCRAPISAIVERLGAPIRRGGDPERAAAERKRLSEARGVWRDRGGLTVDTAEGVQVRFVDAGECEGFDTCRRATFWGERALNGDGSEGPSRAAFAVVEVFHGEGRDWYAVDRRDGELINLGVDPPLASPDGRHWAAGGCDELDGCRLSIWRGSGTAVPEPVTVRGAPAGCCDVQDWRDAASLRVLRDADENADAETPAVITRGPDGGWSLADVPASRPAPER